MIREEESTGGTISKDSHKHKGGTPKVGMDKGGELQNHDQELQENKDLRYNIQQITTNRYLSPRQIENLKNGIGKGRQVIPLQVQTRQSRNNSSSIQ